MGKSTPKHPGYEEMKDTPWITQGREIADIGGKGVLENYNKVNVFDEPTQASLEARNNAIYKRAFDNMEKAYTNTMNKYNANNYNQFGTLNATAPSYITDNYQRDFQRQMDDLAYNQAVNYDTLMDNELNRRYNTLNMFNTMYGYGNTPYQQDLDNWDIRNTNRDINYQNALAGNNKRLNFGGALKGNNNRFNFGGALKGNNNGFNFGGALKVNNNRFNFGGALKGAMSGASTGSAFGHLGALAGGVAGGAIGGFM